jgi:hypothetical protein
VPLASLGQEDFGSGIYRGRKAPDDALYDAVNVLINDEGLPFGRGRSAYYSTSVAASSLRQLWTLYMSAPAANRVLAFSASGIVYALNGSLAPVEVGEAVRLGRPARVADAAIFPTNSSNSADYYGGSLKTSIYNTGTITRTAGSAVVTGIGTAWLANADAGMIFISGAFGVVKSVDSNTQITLTAPFTGSTSIGTLYTLLPYSSVTHNDLPADGGTSYVAAAGSGTPRLLFTVGNRVYYSPRGDPFSFTDTDYHELPANVNIVGAEGRGDSALIFTTGGVYSVGNLSFDDVDAYGNLQHTVEQVTKDVILWGDNGIAGWAGGLVLPCVEDVYVASPDFSLTPVTGHVRALYRSYVKAGYQPGLAGVHRGHYFLPILSGTTLVDTLVCRLDREAAWTRWAGHASSAAYATITEDTAPAPKLLGINGTRVTDLTACMDPAATATDADGTTSNITLTTRDYPTGNNQHGFVQRARLRYELTDLGSPDPTVALAWTSDQDAGTFTTLTEKGEQGGGTGWTTSDGSKYQWALIGRRRERIRLRITVTGAGAFLLRTLELLLKPTGKQ